MDEGRSALLVMDVQKAIVERYSKGEASEMMRPFAEAVAAARGAGIPVMFVRVAFREGFPEVSPKNKSFSAISSAGLHMNAASPATQIHDALAPRPDEPVITKLRVSAFTGSDLEVLLRAQGIDRLVLSGIATSGVVLSTLREAADRDYRLTVLSDACLDADGEVHRVLMEKVFPRQAEVMAVREWERSLERPGGAS